MRRAILFLFVLALALTACEPSSKPSLKGEMPIRIDLSPAAAYGISVDQVSVTITKGSFSQTMNLPISGTNAEGIFTELEAGTYAIDVDVFEQSTLIATGFGSGVVNPAQTTTVYITLQFVPGNLEVVITWGLPYQDCRRILLVGNSHTYFNGGVDAHLQALVNAVHPEWNAVVSARTAGGYTLENHYNDQTTLNTIRQGDWDLVILQEQSSRPMTDPSLFFQYALALRNYAAQNGAMCGYYMTWAWRNNPEMYVPIRDAYRYIAAFTDGLLLPAGVSFYNANQVIGCPDLYDADNYHPSLAGTYLVACTMLAGIWNINPVGNSYIPPQLSPADALFLQQIAWNTVQSRQSRTSKNLPVPLPIRPVTPLRIAA